MPSVLHRPASSLPGTELPWLSLRDHFVATVGPRAGEGRPLGSLLVLADATFAPRSRFPLHPHKEVEILSIVVDGSLSHHGDQAHGASLGPRSAQLISARDGMVHAEGNDTDRPTRMLQLWFQPDTHGGAPAYFSRRLGAAGRQLVAGDGDMPLRADARVWWISVLPDAAEPVVVPPGRRGYILSLVGPICVRSTSDGASVLLETGDGAELAPGEFALTAGAGGAALWVDVPSGPAHADSLSKES
jgi:redox-sensitive bicupin YhaK (pirin superfamily)